ncbi:hypothetical protein BDR05DRAFT_447526 [Suillus weaverae]|nr:hypothetical protein BDR05DRAFT_447526 [Suillus weaverae]
MSGRRIIGSFLCRLRHFEGFEGYQRFRRSIVCCMHVAQRRGLGDMWVASNRHVLHFTMGTEKMILAKADATLTSELDADDNDVPNELLLNHP